MSLLKKTDAWLSLVLSTQVIVAKSLGSLLLTQHTAMCVLDLHWQVTFSGRPTIMAGDSREEFWHSTVNATYYHLCLCLKNWHVTFSGTIKAGDSREELISHLLTQRTASNWQVSFSGVIMAGDIRKMYRRLPVKAACCHLCPFFKLARDFFFLVLFWQAIIAKDLGTHLLTQHTAICVLAFH